MENKRRDKICRRTSLKKNVVISLQLHGPAKEKRKFFWAVKCIVTNNTAESEWYRLKTIWCLFFSFSYVGLRKDFLKNKKKKYV